MKKIIICAVIAYTLFATSSAEAKTISVKSHFRPSTGKYVNSYFKTSPNKIKFDNFSTKSNFNPYTGKKGTVKPYKW